MLVPGDSECTQFDVIHHWSTRLLLEPFGRVHLMTGGFLCIGETLHDLSIFSFFSAKKIIAEVLLSADATTHLQKGVLRKADAVIASTSRVVILRAAIPIVTTPHADCLDGCERQNY